jgi:hypothetical protein
MVLGEWADHPKVVNKMFKLIFILDANLATILPLNLLASFLLLLNVSGACFNDVQGPKHRKQVDRRASKGRKLRYDVHEKLVNFVTPVEQNTGEYAITLFNNLFGGTRAVG